MNRAAIKASEWRWYGEALHLCVSSKCLFHLATEIGGFVVSTVGDYHPADLDGMPESLGVKDDEFYETAVFRFSKRCDCGCQKPIIEVPELKTVKTSDPKKATEVHMEMCKQAAKGVL